MRSRPLPGGRFKKLLTDDAWLDTVRIARDFGTVSELYPPGITDIREIPYRWFDAIRQAMVFLSFDELEKEEKPPKSIWLEPKLLKAHFEWVEARRKEKYSVDGDGGTQEIEEPVDNDAAGMLIAGD